MKNLNIALAVLAVSALPVLALASTYQYVDTGGNLRSVEANSPTQALAIAPQIGIHSGVMLVGQNTGVVAGSIYVAPTIIGTGIGNLYQYVDVSGNLRSVWATSASAALMTAPQIGMHSGVMLVIK